MKKPRFREQQISVALRQAEQGTPAVEVCRKLGVSEATFYAWKKRYVGMGVAELRRVRQLEDENRRLKQAVADLTLDKQMLQEVLQKKGLRPARRRGIARDLFAAYRVSVRRACGLVGCHRATFYYRAKRRDPVPLRMRLRELAAARPRFRVRGTDRAIGLFELAAAAGRPDAPEDLRGPLDGASDETVSTPSFPYGCAVCEVEVDPGDRRGRGRPLHLRGRRRPRHQPADRRRADPRRDRPGPGPGPLGALPLRRGERPAPVRDVHGVRAAARRSPALVHHRDQRGAVYREPARATWAAARAGRPRRSGPR
jgi:putative transposase